MKARAKLMDQARKALYCLHRKLRNISIPIGLQLKLFDTLIPPILTYGCILYNILKIAELDCCQIIILSIYVPSTHA